MPHTNMSKLFHAIMAVSALSLARQHRSKSIDALQHYHQAFPSLQIALRDTNDLCSDGLFLTHFLLLVYEVKRHCHCILYALY